LRYYDSVRKAFHRRIDQVAITILAVRDTLRSKPSIRFVEQADGEFVLAEATQIDKRASNARFRIASGIIRDSGNGIAAGLMHGARVELVLQPSRFMFRPLELPRKASDFLAGIVRSQIDRLTPWTAAEAAFGWRSSIEPANDKVSVTIVATARNLLAPFAQAIANCGADTVILTAPDPRVTATTIEVLEQKVGQAADLSRLRRLLIGFAAGSAAIAALSLAAGTIGGSLLEQGRDEINERITSKRAALKPGQNSPAEMTRELERRKHETPSAVIAIDALSQVLPDDTYVTELRIVGDKIQIIGLTKDAPALIRLLEQTPHFSRASFFAPTTRSETEQREHFHIEAHIEPVFTPGL